MGSPMHHENALGYLRVLRSCAISWRLWMAPLARERGSMRSCSYRKPFSTRLAIIPLSEGFPSSSRFPSTDRLDVGCDRVPRHPVQVRTNGESEVADADTLPRV